MADEKDVLRVVQSRSYREMNTDELARNLSVPAGEMDAFVALLQDLERRGALVKVKKMHWVNPERAGLVTGRLQGNEKGFGFVVPLVRRADEGDVYVAQEEMGEAMHGDLVVVEVHRKKPGRAGGRAPASGPGKVAKKLGPSGRIIKVLEHRNMNIIGTFVPGSKFGRVVPDNPRLFRDIYIAPDDWMGAQADDQVLVAVTEWPSLHRNPEGEIKQVLGKVGTPGVDLQSVIIEFGLPREFSAEVLREAERLRGSPSADERKKRRDFTKNITVTIDPEDAKDFDDALSFQRDRGTGRRVVLVHIADLSYHVPPDGILDLEARERGMSVYLANDVVPMLPHQQSKYTLSLVEGKDRLAKTVAMKFDEAGRLADYSLHHSIINVARRMTYTEVQEVLDAVDAEGPAVAGAAERLPKPIANLLVELDALAGQLRERRVEKGSIDLDMPEYHVAVDEEGRVVGVSQLERFRSYGLVEEFMLSANRCVADFLRKNKLPGLYRIHDQPLEEDLEEFGAFIQPILGRRVNVLDRKELQHLIDEVSGTHLAEAVNMQLLRAMQRAVYSPHCKPHFALHFERYSHFTSPVRRYPDLAVHQILDQFVKERRNPAQLRHDWEAKLENIAAHCNEMQDRADEAEREIIKIKLLRYLQDHKDKVFEAVVTGVQEYGLFARLEGYSVEGLIKVQDIGDDFYRFDEKKKALIGTRRHREFRLGQPIKVTIKEINMARRQLDLVLYE